MKYEGSYLNAVGIAFAGVGDMENGVRYLRLALMKARARRDSKLAQSIGDEFASVGWWESTP